MSGTVLGGLSVLMSLQYDERFRETYKYTICIYVHILYMDINTYTDKHITNYDITIMQQVYIFSATTTP